VETAMVAVLFVTLVMCTLEFGRAWMVANMITHAARDGARIAAVVPASGRSTSGTISSTSSIETQVLTDIQNVVPTTALSAHVTQPTVNGVPMVQVLVSGSVPYLFYNASMSVSRTVTFRDEGR
jgi:Flp pilus assembly protein TadG